MYYGNQDKDFARKVTRIILECLSEEEKQAYEEELANTQPTKKRTYVPDIILPKGCVKLGWENPTLVEVKHTIYPHASLSALQKLKEESKVNNYQVVLIYYVSPYAPLSQAKLDVSLMTFNELRERTNTKRYIRHSVNLLTNEKKKENCKKEFKKGKFTLFLGAGVSMSAGLPGWNDLLYRMLEKGNKEKAIIKREDKVFFKRAFDGSNMVMARYLRILCENNAKDEFFNEVRNALYLNGEKKDSQLLNSVVELIHHKSQGERNVNKIITYNYDDLLESKIRERRELESRIFCYNGDEKECSEKQVPIYHVHGLISKYYEHPDNDEYIVFSEETYNYLYNNREDREEWINSVQMKALNKSTCLFIGMSMSDPNLRCLLENWHSKKGSWCKHYAFLSKHDFYNDISFIPQKEIVDKMFYELGVNVIWYDEHEELPGLLMGLMN